MSDEPDVVEVDLEVAYAALQKARALIEGNATADEPKDPATLRRVYSLVLDALYPIAGARGVVRHRRELQAVIDAAVLPRLEVVR